MSDVSQAMPRASNAKGTARRATISNTLLHRIAIAMNLIMSKRNRYTLGSKSSELLRSRKSVIFGYA
jgi:hypothetical protein